MSYKYEETCPYCDTEYSVEFESEDDILANCPACGEQVPEFDDDDDEMMIDEDEEWEE
jgi:transcription initiation factor IIE alpha subunit